MYECSEVAEHTIEIRLAIEGCRYLNLAWNRRHMARDQADDNDERHEGFSCLPFLSPHEGRATSDGVLIVRVGNGIMTHLF